MDEEVLATLKEQMALFEKQTPSSPDWYRVIDTVVGTLLALEIQRREKP
jgi:hypothetical protein